LVHGQLVRRFYRSGAGARSIVVVNRGPARAREVRVEAVNASTANLFVDGELRTFPVDLDVEQEHPLTVVLTADDPPRADLRITWRDGLGDQVNELSLNLT
jgi:hypothetical protein